MKKRILVIVMVALCSVIFAAEAKSQKMWIAVSSANVKSSTGFFSKTTGTLLYGAEVTVIESKGSKSKITSGKVTGWIPTSSLSKRKIVGKGSNFSANADELALAGKGFNEEVEKQYKKSGKSNYAAVDKVESISVSDNELLLFIKEGKLQGAEE